MKKYVGLGSTAQKYLSGVSTVSNNKNYKCQNCALQFQSSAQLFNHSKKFCLNSGFDTLAGLNVRLKNPNYKQQKQTKRRIDDSLTNALDEIEKNKTFIPKQKQLVNDYMGYQKYQQDIQYKRPYIHRSKNQAESGRKSKSLFIKQKDHQKISESKYSLSKYPEKRQKQSRYDQFAQQSGKSKVYSFTQSYVKKFKQSNCYISPASQIPQLQNAKMFSLLDRSDMSIQNMPEQQKRDYVVRKILQLQSIQEIYLKNGGKKDKLIQNTQKMQVFYKNLLQDINNHKQSKFGKVQNYSRASTPISRLQKLNNSQVLTESLVKVQRGRQSKLASKLSDIHYKSMARRQDKIRNRLKTQNLNNLHQSDESDILDQQVIKNVNKHNKDKNQIIVIPINQPGAQQSNHQNNLNVKYFQKLMELKGQQNKKIMQMMNDQKSQMRQIYQDNLRSKDKQSKINDKKLKSLQDNYNKILLHQRLNKNQNHLNYPNDNFKPNNNFKPSQVRNRTQYSENMQPQEEYRERYKDLPNVRKLKLQQDGFHAEQNDEIQNEQKILLQMQKQQRDQLQLFSHLPHEIQKIKIQSIKEMAEKRHQMEKQVIKQKVQKLQMAEKIKYFELERKLMHVQIENEKKKIDIHRLMKKKIKDLTRQEFQQYSSQSQPQEDSGEDDPQQNAYIQPKQRQNLPNPPEDKNHKASNRIKNITPIID